MNYMFVYLLGVGTLVPLYAIMLFFVGFLAASMMASTSITPYAGLDNANASNVTVAGFKF